MSSDIPSPITNPPARTTPAQAAANEAAAPSPTPIVIHAGGRWGSMWSRLGWTGFIFCAIALVSLNLRYADYFDNTGGITEKYHSGGKYATDKIAILTVSGAIMEGDGFAKKQINKILEDEHVKGVVIRIDSPGGTVSGSDYIYHHLKKMRAEKLKKLREKDNSAEFPMIVSMGSIAASGGYYIAMAVEDQPKSIYAEPTTTTGSIGVMIPHYDLTGLMTEYGVKDDSIATHPRKLMLSMTKEMTKEERELALNYINESFARFKSIIKEGRPHFKKNEADLDVLATGEIFSANQAKKTGLIDEIGFMEDAIDRVRELAGLDKDNVRVVKYDSPTNLFDLGFAQSSRASASPLEALCEMSTPRAYYMCSTLPALLRAK
jgi:protease-4